MSSSADPPAAGGELGNGSFSDTRDYAPGEIERIVDLIALLKDPTTRAASPELLRDIAPGCRGAFDADARRLEVAMVKLGGRASYLKPGETHLGARRSLNNTAKVLGRPCGMRALASVSERCPIARSARCWSPGRRVQLEATNSSSAAMPSPVG